MIRTEGMSEDSACDGSDGALPGWLGSQGDAGRAESQISSILALRRVKGTPRTVPG